MHESVVTSRGRTSLPKAVRASLGLKPGDRVRYIVGNGEVRLIKVRSVMEMKGMLHRPGAQPKSLKDLQRGMTEGAVRGSGLSDDGHG